MKERVGRKTRESFEKKSRMPAVALTASVWLMLAFLVGWVDPVVVRDFLVTDSYLLLFLLIFLAMFLLLGFFLKPLRRSMFIAFSIAFYLFLQLKGIGTMFNLVVLLLMFVVLEMFLSVKQGN